MTRLPLKIINLTMVQYTLDTLNATQDKILRTRSKSSNTEEARKFGKMDRNMKVNFPMGNQMEKEFSIVLMVILMKETLKIH